MLNRIAAIEGVLTAAEVADVLKVHPRTVLRLAQEGRIPAMRLSKQWRFHRDTILLWMEGQMQGALAGAPVQIDPGPLGKEVTIYSLLRPVKMQMRLEGRSRDAVLEELVGLIDAAGVCTDARELLRLVREREGLCSTGLQHGVALPHPRHAVPDLVRRTVIAYGRSPEGVEFGSLDGRPSRIFFLTCATHDGDHLKILARLGYLFRDPLFCNRIAVLERPEEVIETLRRKAEEEGHDLVGAPFVARPAPPRTGTS